METTSITILSLVTLLATGCTSEPRDIGDATDLRTSLGVDNASVVGVTIDPVTGSRYVFDAEAGLFEMYDSFDGEGATQIVSIDDLPDPGVEIRLPFTDIVSLGDHRFALTAIGDGFLLDIAANELSQYFCYEPDGFPQDVEQRTNAVAYDTLSQTIYAQPRTFSVDTGDVVGSAIGAYPIRGGQPRSWYELDIDFDAGASAIDPETGELLFAEGARLHRFDFESQALEQVADLSEHGIERIEGMTINSTGDLIVADGARDLLFTLQPEDWQP